MTHTMQNMQYKTVNFLWRNQIHETQLSFQIQLKGEKKGPVASNRKKHLPLIDSASKSLANHVSKLSISHLTPGITINSKVLQRNKFTL